MVLTLVTLYDFSALAAEQNFDSATGPWQNLGAGGWMAAAALFLAGVRGLPGGAGRPARR